jgi:two-component system phosphate regulon sensor histidine kinase PhoR
MLWRFSVFSLFLLAGGGLVVAGRCGWRIGRRGGCQCGLVCVDLLRGTRMLRWLRHADPSSAPHMNGLWGEVADRTRRALRTRQTNP